MLFIWVTIRLIIAIIMLIALARTPKFKKFSIPIVNLKVFICLCFILNNKGI